MRSTQQPSVTLPIEMAAAVKAKVSTGEYATECEVIRDGLRALLARDRAMEDWLRNEVIPLPRHLRPIPSAHCQTTRSVRTSLPSVNAKVLIGHDLKPEVLTQVDALDNYIANVGSPTDAAR